MYIVAIAWLYVALMMAITEPSLVAGALTLLFYGLLPCALLLWLVGTPQRRRSKALREVAEQDLGEPDRSHAEDD
jgi:sulfite exporter TauE/SafE